MADPNMTDPETALAAYERLAVAAYDRWLRGVSDTPPPQQFVVEVPVPDDPSSLEES